MLNIADIRTEYRENPIGIDVKSPRFSWKLKSDRRNVLQHSYHIEVYAKADGTQRIWDSGRVASDRSVHVGYRGPQLEPRRRYFFRVRITDNAGEISSWSDLQYFETGIGEPSRWQSQWITADVADAADRQTMSPLLRKVFTLSEVPAAARVYVSALGLYELWINGQRVGDWLLTPGWTSFGHRLQYQTYDVTSLLQRGENVVGAVLGNGWYAGEIGWSQAKAHWGQQRALLLELHRVDGGEPSLMVATDSTWSFRWGPIACSEIYHGETYDARQAVDGWSSPHTSQQGWAAVTVLDHPKDILVAQENLPTRVTMTLQPVSRLRTPGGDDVIDFGQNLTGWVRLEVTAPAGTAIRLEHAEVLDQEGNFYVKNLRGAKQTVVYVAKGRGREVFEPHFSFQGFRYVRVSGYPGELPLESLSACVVRSDLEETLSFSCSSPELTQLQKNIVWGQRGNFVDVPTDCPQRDERLGWTGDAQVFVGTAAFNMNVAPFFTKWLRDLAADQTPSGSVPHVIPNVLGPSAYGSAAWADAAVIIPWTLYLQYGDANLLEEQYPSMRAWVEFMRNRGPSETMHSDGFHFGDWLGLDSAPGSYVGATAIDLIANAFYAYSTGLLAKSAAVLGKEDDYREYETLHRRIVEAFQDEFVTPNGRLASPTQTACVLALWMQLVRPEHVERVVSTLEASIRERETHLSTGFVGTPYLLHALTRYGRVDTAYDLLLQTTYPSWLYPLSQGATTIWEHWDGIKPDGTFWSPDMNSFNHYAYGAVGEWIYRVMAGINPVEDAPGFKSILIRPIPHAAIDWARAAYDSLYGRIDSEWRLHDGRFELTVEVPANTTARVEFPHRTLTGWTSDADGVDLHQDPGGAWVALGSGRYRFSYEIQSPERR